MKFSVNFLFNKNIVVTNCIYKNKMGKSKRVRLSRQKTNNNNLTTITDNIINNINLLNTSDNNAINGVFLKLYLD